MFIAVALNARKGLKMPCDHSKLQVQLHYTCNLRNFYDDAGCVITSGGPLVRDPWFRTTIYVYAIHK
jgi:hypothetical protein